MIVSDCGGELLCLGGEMDVFFLLLLLLFSLGFFSLAWPRSKLVSKVITFGNLSFLSGETEKQKQKSKPIFLVTKIDYLPIYSFD